ncbi:MAG: dephospho-CoA kinase [Bacteroidetes bacterium]|nr:dephospho-CoA kinase [Bacteroidota bacterium]
MKKIGITGNMGSGKSTVAKLFMQLGFPVYDADSRAKLLMVTIPSLIKSIQSIFGPMAYTEDGQLNRGYISEIAFRQPEKLKLLNETVHPAVRTDFTTWAESQAVALVVKEAALMIESGSYHDLDALILVRAPLELRIQRSMARDGKTREEIELRLKNQMSEEDKVPFAQFQIYNDEKHLLIPQVNEVVNAVLSA